MINQKTAPALLQMTDFDGTLPWRAGVCHRQGKSIFGGRR
jgi:hypothetical protein